MQTKNHDPARFVSKDDSSPTRWSALGGSAVAAMTSASAAMLILAGCSNRPEPKHATSPAAATRPANAAHQSARQTGPANAAHQSARQTRPQQGPPLAHRSSVVDVLYGIHIPDPYRWLENAKSPQTQAWVHSMDRYSRHILSKLPGRDTLAKRLAQLSYVDWVSPPLRRGKRYFFSRRSKTKEKAIFSWRQGAQGTEHILLDPNTMSKDGSIAIHGVWVDYQGRRVAYALSHNNADEATLYLMDVATGKVSTIDTIKGAKYADPSWTPKGKGFYYTRLPVDPKISAADRPGYAEVYYHRVGTDPKTDRLIYPKTGDPSIFIAAEVSRDGRWLFLYKAHGWSRMDVYYKDLRKGPKSPFVPLAVAPKAQKVIYQVFAWKGRFYIQTNEGAPRYRLFRVRATRPQRSHWKEIVPEQTNAVLDSFSIRGNRLALRYLTHAITELRIHRLSGRFVRRVSFPGLGTASGLTGNPEDDAAYYSYSSFTRPTTIYRTSMRKGGRSLYFQVKLPINSSLYITKQVWYPSKDGTKISMFLIGAHTWKRGGTTHSMTLAPSNKLKKDGNNPTILYGYGGFDVSLTPHFSATWMTWLEQGGTVAIPNLRGGGEYGEAWHQAGMLDKKQNVFDDFVWAAKWLIANHYTRPERLAIRGGSNGGLLVGAAMVEAPKLFGVVICHVPLLDMLRYHKFGGGKTWISEYGTADNEKQFRFLRAYSPYQQVRKGTAYPALLMMSADSDDRVDPMHARKFTAAIRWATSSHRPVLLRVETKSGHGGGDMVKKRVAATADELAFMMWQMGLKPAPPQLLQMAARRPESIRATTTGTAGRPAASHQASKGPLSH